MIPNRICLNKLQLITILCILVFSSSWGYCAETISAFDEKTLPVLNEELNKRSREIDDNEDDISTNVTNISTNTTGIATVNTTLGTSPEGNYTDLAEAIGVIKEIKFGSYAGTDTPPNDDDRNITVGFTDTSLTVKFIWIYTAGEAGEVMMDNQDSGFALTDGSMQADGIQTIGVNTFQVGSRDTVNKASTTHYFIAIGG